MINTEKYWEDKYQNQKTGWDMGEVSPPLKAYFDQLEDKTIDIFFPGAGNAYEAEYLFNLGFNNIYVADISKIPLTNFSNRIPDFSKNQLLHKNFFDVQKRFDLIIEQTFFCALPPKLRPDYAQKMQQLLKPKAKLVGVLFDFPLDSDEPPFGGNKTEYLSYFEDYFEINVLDRCYNSHPKRDGKELFFNLKNKN